MICNLFMMAFCNAAEVSLFAGSAMQLELAYLWVLQCG